MQFNQPTRRIAAAVVISRAALPAFAQVAATGAPPGCEGLTHRDRHQRPAAGVGAWPGCRTGACSSPARRLAIGARVRDVRQGPDGHLYLLTDESNARILRIVPDKR